MTVEGEHDDISGVGQTKAAHQLLSRLPDKLKAHWLQPGVGHYGVFNGSRFRAEIAPRIADFVLTHNSHFAGHGADGKIASIDARRVARLDSN
jgi:poly(3-hydroxybutyrate) depolymerase